jgi:hypothetical protein
MEEKELKLDIQNNHPRYCKSTFLLKRGVPLICPQSFLRVEGAAGAPASKLS